MRKHRPKNQRLYRNRKRRLEFSALLNEDLKKLGFNLSRRRR